MVACVEKNEDAIGRKREAFYMAVAFATIIFNRVRKIENAIINSGQHLTQTRPASMFSSMMSLVTRNINEKENKITSGQLQAFRELTFNNAFIKSGIPLCSNILLLEKEQGVHAELQILSEILKLKEGKQLFQGDIYVGVSKRCCLECHRMLEATNTVLSTKGITIKFGGAHDASFSSGWVKPSIFAQNHDEDVSKIWAEYQRLRREDGRQAVNKIEKKRKRDNKRKDDVAEEPVQYEQGHSMSNSDFSFDSEERFRRYREELERDLEIFMLRGQEGSDAASMMGLGLKLCEIPAFQYLFDEDEEVGSERVVQIKLVTMIAQLSERNEQEQIELDRLLSLLQNPHFMDDGIVKFFSGIRALNQEQRSESKLTLSVT